MCHGSASMLRIWNVQRWEDRFEANTSIHKERWCHIHIPNKGARSIGPRLAVCSAYLAISTSKYFWLQSMWFYVAISQIYCISYDICIYIYTYISYWVNPTVWPQKSCQGHLQHWLTSAKSLRPRAPRFALKPEKLLGSIQRVTMPKQPSCIQQVNVRTRYQMNFDVAHSRRKDDKRWLTDSLTDYDILWLSHWLGPSNSIELIAMVVLPRQ